MVSVGSESKAWIVHALVFPSMCLKTLSQRDTPQLLGSVLMATLEVSNMTGGISDSLRLHYSVRAGCLAGDVLLQASF